MKLGFQSKILSISANECIYYLFRLPIKTDPFYHDSDIFSQTSQFISGLIGNGNLQLAL